MHECPDFDKDGSCPNLKCKLPHIERAGRRRAAAAAQAAANPPKTQIKREEGNNMDIDATNSNGVGSDDDDEDEDAIDSDVDSDTFSDYDFILHRDDATDQADSMQEDFIKF